MIPSETEKIIKENIKIFNDEAYKELDEETFWKEIENFFREELIGKGLDRKEFREKLKEIWKTAY